MDFERSKPERAPVTPEWPKAPKPEGISAPVMAQPDRAPEALGVDLGSLPPVDRGQIGVGDLVKSYDFPDLLAFDPESAEQFYVEGVVRDITRREFCSRYEIEVTKRVQAGQEQPLSADKPEFVYPPVNGVPIPGGRPTCGVMKLGPDPLEPALPLDQDIVRQVKAEAQDLWDGFLNGDKETLCERLTEGPESIAIVGCVTLLALEHSQEAVKSLENALGERAPHRFPATRGFDAAMWSNTYPVGEGSGKLAYYGQLLSKCDHQILGADEAQSAFGLVAMLAEIEKAKPGSANEATNYFLMQRPFLADDIVLTRLSSVGPGSSLLTKDSRSLTIQALGNVPGRVESGTLTQYEGVSITANLGFMKDPAIDEAIVMTLIDLEDGNMLSDYHARAMAMRILERKMDQPYAAGFLESLKETDNAAR